MTPRPKRKELVERDAEILSLWAQGYSYRDIAKNLGGALSHVGVFQVVKRYKEKATVSHIHERREREAEYLEHLRSQLQPRIDRGEVEAIAEGRRVSESMRKLYGLDAPVTQQVEISNGEPRAWDNILEAVLVPQESLPNHVRPPLAIESPINPLPPNSPPGREVGNDGTDTSEVL